MALRSIDNIHAIFRKIKNSYYIEQISQKSIIDKFENLTDNNFRIKAKLLNLIVSYARISHFYHALTNITSSTFPKKQRFSKIFLI